MKAPRVILADDHILMMEGLRRLLEPRCEIVGAVSDGRTLVELACKLNPDVVLVDIAMPLLNGLEAVRQLRVKSPAIKLICLTMNEDTDLAAEALRIGASGYLLKTSVAGEVFQAIEECMRGRSYVTPRIARGIEEAFIRNPRPKVLSKKLTQRQREVTQLIAEGKSLKETAHLLNLSARTVAFHKYQLMEELRLKTTADLIRYAVKNRIGVV
jgi:DNA-binding NarL/FixJ family response regulator